MCVFLFISRALDTFYLLFCYCFDSPCLRVMDILVAHAQYALQVFIICVKQIVICVADVMIWSFLVSTCHYRLGRGCSISDSSKCLRKEGTVLCLVRGTEHLLIHAAPVIQSVPHSKFLQKLKKM